MNSSRLLNINLLKSVNKVNPERQGIQLHVVILNSYQKQFLSFINLHTEINNYRLTAFFIIPKKSLYTNLPQ